MDETQPEGSLTSLDEPFRAYNFKLEINGVIQGHFAECSGLGVKVQSISYREAGERQIVHRLPGQVEYSDVTLRYGLTQSRELWDWFLTSMSGNVDRRGVSIVMLDGDGWTELTRWNLEQAWPSEWRGAPLAAMENGVAIETITLVFESLTRV